MTDAPISPADAADDSASAESPAPSLYLNASDLDKFGLHDCQVGDEYTATLKFRVSSVSDPSNGGGEPSKTLEITSLDDVTPANDSDVADETPAETSAESGEEPADTSDFLGFEMPPKKPGAPVDHKKLRSL